MRIPRIYQPGALTPGDEVELAEQAAVHVARVLRLKEAAAVVRQPGALLFDQVQLAQGRGQLAGGTLFERQSGLVVSRTVVPRSSSPLGSYPLHYPDAP